MILINIIIKMMIIIAIVFVIVIDIVIIQYILKANTEGLLTTPSVRFHSGFKLLLNSSTKACYY